MNPIHVCFLIVFSYLEGEKMRTPIKNAKDTIVSKGRVLLFQNGYFRLSISQLAHESNIATGTFYNYFPSKADLVIHIIQADWNAILERIDIIIKTNSSSEG